MHLLNRKSQTLGVLHWKSRTRTDDRAQIRVETVKARVRVRCRGFGEIIRMRDIIDSFDSAWLATKSGLAA